MDSSASQTKSLTLESRLFVLAARLGVLLVCETKTNACAHQEHVCVASPKLLLVWREAGVAVVLVNKCNRGGLLMKAAAKGENKK